ncbi:MAG: dihydrofolate reductase [Cytophagales bacterium]|nr:MAG: dihydrofolate reductase [Cytophagales bacterium]
MRKLKVQMQTSVDGFVAGINDEMDWLTFDWDQALKQGVANIMEPVDTILLGRKLAEGFIPHWASEPEYEDPISIKWMNEMPKVVFSTTLTQIEWPNTRLAVGELTDEINKLKSLSGGDLIAYGGATFVASLLKAGLVDELNLFVNPVALGKGKSIFGLLENPQQLKPICTKFFSCGITWLEFEVVR